MRAHPALVDGYDNVHRRSSTPSWDRVEATAGEWQPSDTRAPGLGDLVGALNDLLKAVAAATGLLGMVENAVRTVSASPREHHVAGVEVDLDVLAEVRTAFGCTTHDVLLALGHVGAGVRGWLLDHGRAPRVTRSRSSCWPSRSPLRCWSRRSGAGSPRRGSGCRSRR
ncbi:MAG: hypothetical protein U0R79_03275 [Propionicimonas sp.]